MRTAALARAVGVSTQTIRNLETRGILPPAPRLANGYRSYGECHLAALHAYRALTDAFDIATAGHILILIQAGEVDSALRTITARICRHDAERHHLDDTIAALQHDPPKQQSAHHGLRTITETARALHIKASTLRVWEGEGLLEPGRSPTTGYRHYSPSLVRRASLILTLRRAGLGIPHIRDLLSTLDTDQDATRLLEALRERHQQLSQRTRRIVTAMSRLENHLSAWDGTQQSIEDTSSGQG